MQAPGSFQTSAPQFPATCSSQTESLGVPSNECPRIFWHPHYDFPYASSPTQNTHSLASVWLEASHPSLKGRLKCHLCQSIHPSIKDLTNHTELSVFNCQALGLNKQEWLRQSPRHREALRVGVLSGTFPVLTFFILYAYLHDHVYDSWDWRQERYMIIYVVLIMSMDLSKMAANRCSINTWEPTLNTWRIKQSLASWSFRLCLHHSHLSPQCPAQHRALRP